MTYVQRRANRYEFRFRLPEQLAGKKAPANLPFTLRQLTNTVTGRFKREIVRTLRTNDVKVANRDALVHLAEAHSLVDEAQRFLRDGSRQGISSDRVAALAKAHEIGILLGDERTRRAGVGLDLKQHRREPDGQGLTDDDLQLYRFTVRFLDKEARDATARMRAPESTKLAVDQALEDAGITLAPDDPARRDLELGFLAAERRAFDTINARLQGDLIETPVSPERATGITIMGAVQRWAVGGGRGAKKPRARSIDEARRAAARFVELHGDLDITQVSRAHARELRDALAKVPTRLPGKLSRIPLPELLKKDLRHLPPRSAQTVNKTLNLLGGVFARAERDGYFDGLLNWSNPFRVTLEVSPLEREPYEPLTTEELNALFSSPVFAKGDRPRGGKGEAAYWLPLVALYSGARRTEIAQLRASDVRQSPEGIWYFDVTASGDDQHVKNLSSARITPVHPELIRLGLTEWVRMRASTSPDAPLWPGFEPPIEAKAKAWTKWFGRYLGRYVTEDPAKTFHSFRHTFKRACREAGLSEEIHNALTGHSGGGVGRGYGRERRDDGGLDRGVSLARLAQEIAKVQYPGVDVPSSSGSASRTSRSWT